MCISWHNGNTEEMALLAISRDSSAVYIYNRETVRIATGREKKEDGPLSWEW